MEYPDCSLIISTYNWPEALDLCLKSAINQSISPNEIIIADDGSREETKYLIEHYTKISKVQIVHVWHEDTGFKLAEIRNKAIAKSSYSYIIQVDGDVILNSNFVKDHLIFAKKKQYLFGSRVNIVKSFLPTLFSTKMINFNFFSLGIKKRFRSLRLPFLMKMQKPLNSVSLKLRGCNMSFWKEDFLKINGYNEDFFGWGGEDYELAHRFHKIGLVGKRLKFTAIIYHIYHKEAAKNNLDYTHQVLDKSLNSTSFFTENGIDKHIQS
ncbi:MAG TPA: glycosyltransferase family 2 protein [Flavobacterium sp.]|uniref:glycosyltransferase family 2 protein n=1 Tax=unclassified Flavobacterium TaxID=196869 RepID=UPI0025C538C4|nr:MULTISPECIES: glycosyltransferase family 2 protein [unclassified Flavobacterium]HRE77217.1 glycosyltransferase family 2 protein [Flavobacterium sp.]